MDQLERIFTTTGPGSNPPLWQDSGESSWFKTDNKPNWNCPDKLKPMKLQFGWNAYHDVSPLSTYSPFTKALLNRLRNGLPFAWAKWGDSSLMMLQPAEYFIQLTVKPVM